MKTYIFLLFLSISICVQSQSDLKKQKQPTNEINFKHIIEKNKSKNYKAILKEIDNFYIQKPELRKKDEKKFLRWQQFTQNRLDQNGNIVNVNAKTRDAYFYQKSINESSTKADYNTNQKAASIAWTNVPHQLSKKRGRVECVAVDPSDPNVIYSGANTGGLWKSTNGGNSWIPLTDKLPALGVTSVVIDANSPSNNRRIYIFVGDGGWGSQYHSSGVYVSNDGGNNWEMTGLQFNETDTKSSGRKLMIDPNNSNILYALLWKDLYKSEDAGQTWTRSNLDNKLYSYGFYDLEFCPDDSNTLYVIEDEAIFHRSIDGGATWSKTTIPGNSSRGIAIDLAVTPANPNAVFFLGMDKDMNDETKFHGIYKSIDKGGSFSLFSNDVPANGVNGNLDGSFFNQRYGIAQIAVSPTNENNLFIGSLRTFKYDNNINKLVVVDRQINHVDIRHLSFFSNRLFNGNDGGLDITDDFGNTWKDISNNMIIKQIYGVTTESNNSNNIAIGTQDNGASFIESSTEDHLVGGDTFAVAQSKLFDRVYINNNYRLFYIYETNPKKNASFTSISEYFGALNITDSYTENGANIDVALIGYGKNIKRAFIDQNYNIDFQDLTNNKFDNYWHKFAVSESNSNNFYGLARNNILVKSTNLKQNNPDFVDISNNVPTITNEFRCITTSGANHVWMGSNGYTANEKLFYSENGGQSWNNISAGLPNTPVNCLAIQIHNDKEVIYAGTDIGVYFYINGESQQWMPYYNESLPGVIINALDFNKKDQVLTAGTWGRGVWQINADGSTLSVHDDIQIKETSIIAYPNPVSDKLYLKTNTSFDSEAIVSIYDIKGKLVYSRKLESIESNEAISIDMTTLNSGIYVLHFNNFKNKQIIKVLKQ